MDDTNTLKEPLTLVTRNLAMQVQSQLLRENKPAVPETQKISLKFY